MRSLMLILSLLIILPICVNAQSAQKQKIVYAPHNISSIKQTGDSLEVNQMVILENKNLNAFIADLKKSQIILGRRVKGIPPMVKDFLSSFSKDKFSIADPGKNWNCCDGSWDETLPNRQLINVGADGKLFIIAYQTGGIGVTTHIILVRYNDDKILDFWVGIGKKDLKTTADILKYLVTNKNKHWELNTNVIQI